jgi:hypothetical protein
LGVLAACSGSSDAPQSATVEKPAVVTRDVTSPGAPSAPINFSYVVQGTPIVGQPVSVDITISTSVDDAPIRLFYRVNDATSMLFPESQARSAEVVEMPGNKPRMQQITVIPQREGRLYLNVSAEIDTDRGTLLKTTSIPIQVGSAPPEMESNGELVETAEGETVISLPASQSND